MAYMRGEIYIWANDTHIHFWACEGYDGWDKTGWHDSSMRAKAASGVALPHDVADEFVVMRLAQMLDEGCLTDAVARAVGKWRGNGGCHALIEYAGVLCEVATRGK